MSQAFYGSIQAFRGIAIATIVAAHTWAFLIFWTGKVDSPSINWVYAITETLFHGSTLYFALISGLLFSLVLQHKGWRRFASSKLKFVLLPYCLITLLCTWVYWDFTRQATPDAEPLSTYLTGLAGGSASVQLWYIPLLMGLFVLTPGLVWLQQRWPWLLWLLVLLPLVISRSSFPDLLTWPTLVYFTGAYVLGLLWGAHYQPVIEILRRYQRVLAGVVIATSLWVGWSYYQGHAAGGLWFYRQSLIYVQKLTFAALLLCWLESRALSARWAMRLGDYAFAIFFLHVLVLDRFYFGVYDWLMANRTGFTLAWLGLLNLVWTLLGSLALAWIIRTLTGRYSRLVVGV